MGFAGGRRYSWTCVGAYERQSAVLWAALAGYRIKHGATSRSLSSNSRVCASIRASSNTVAFSVEFARGDARPHGGNVRIGTATCSSGLEPTAGYGDAELASTIASRGLGCACVSD